MAAQKANAIPASFGQLFHIIPQQNLIVKSIKQTHCTMNDYTVKQYSVLEVPVQSTLYIPRIIK